MKKAFLSLIMVLGVIFICNEGLKISFAYNYDVDTSVLFYKDDVNELSGDVKKYIENLDDIIIPNSTFLYSDILTENYDFLIYFATDYILKNQDYYNEQINNFEDCKYINSLGIEKSTTDYVDLNTIYEITDFYFGIKDFSVINDDVCTKDNYISLVDYNDNNFNLKIEDVKIEFDGVNVNAFISYDNNNKYLYYFLNDNNILKLKNIEVII